MNKVLIKLYIPIIEEQYDIFIPQDRKIQNVIMLLIKAINGMNNGNYKPNKMPVLYERDSAKAYNLNESVREAHIRNGTELVLI